PKVCPSPNRTRIADRSGTLRWRHFCRGRGGSAGRSSTSRLRWSDAEPNDRADFPRMTWRRWAFTAVSFAAGIGVSIFFILRWWRAGSSIVLPPRAHLLAITAVVVEILTRSWKITWSAKAANIKLRFMTALRTTLAGDFGASITPGRSGAEPAR